MTKASQADLERGGDDLSGVVKVKRRDLREVGRARVGDRPTSTKRVQQDVHGIQLLN